jgi:hypothetical protein
MTMSDPHSGGIMSRALDIFGGGSNSGSGESASQDEFFESDSASRDHTVRPYSSANFLSLGKLILKYMAGNRS